MDLIKLSPAPWIVNDDFISGPNGFPLLLAENYEPEAIAALALAALARNALAIQLETGLHAFPISLDKWVVRTMEGKDMPLRFFVENDHRGAFPDPITAITEAHKWLKEQEARNTGAGGG